MDYSKLNDIIKSSKNILIISHINPDGDTLGSMCGLANAIKENLKKKCDTLIVSSLPKIYEFLPLVKDAKHIDTIDKSREYDLVINVDVAALDRICDGQILFNKAKFTVNIDHHKTNNGYADLNIINPDASSTGEIICDILKSFGWKISYETAVCLYTAVLTDTGSFRFNNTTPKTLETASELLKTGIHPAEIYKYCYESNPKSLVLLQAYCLEKAVFSDDDKIVYTTVYKKDIEKFCAGEDCTEGLTEKLRAITTTEVAFVVKQSGHNITKVSMRSKGLDVAAVCAAFGGGGHTLAAGCVVKASVEETVRKILDEVHKKMY